MQSTHVTEQQRQQFNETGILVVENFYPDFLLDGAREDLSPHLGFDSRPLAGVSHSSSNRIQDAWPLIENVREIALYGPMLDLLGELFGQKARPFQTLNFKYGTEQATHSDTIHFNSEPFGMMCGVWVAFEDIGPDQGPLEYFLGSNQFEEMNFEDFGIEADYANYPLYEDAVRDLIASENLEASFGTIGKGSAIIWAANLLHGGSPQIDKNLTRWSQVTHYYFGNHKWWRPGLSSDKRFYYEPEWITPKTSPTAVYMPLLRLRARAIKSTMRNLVAHLRSAKPEK